jgi:hypothetical protein
MISGAYDKINLPGKEEIQIVKVNRVEDAVKSLFKTPNTEHRIPNTEY